MSECIHDVHCCSINKEVQVGHFVITGCDVGEIESSDTALQRRLKNHRVKKRGVGNEIDKNEEKVPDGKIAHHRIHYMERRNRMEPGDEGRSVRNVKENLFHDGMKKPVKKGFVDPFIQDKTSPGPGPEREILFSHFHGREIKNFRRRRRRKDT